jgi:hypothetical protein
MIIHDAWTIDGVPAEFNTPYRLDAVIAIKPIKLVYIMDKEQKAEIQAFTFYVILTGGLEIPHCRRHREVRPLETLKAEAEAYRRDLIIKWAEALKEKHDHQPG